jgi:hypothetical protein
VAALLDRPEVIDTMISNRVVSFSQLLDALGSDALFAGRNWQEFGARSEDLFYSYVAVVAVADWDEAVSRADRPDPSPSGTGWRTVLIRGANGSHGLLAPQTYVSGNYAAFLSGPEERSRILRVNLDRGSIRLLAGGSGHCSPPVGGACAGGSCGGCQAVVVWDTSTNGPGVDCRCPDSQ